MFDLDRFVSAGGAGNQPDPVPGHPELFCEIRGQFGIGLAFDRGGSDPQLEAIAIERAELRAAGAGLQTQPATENAGPNPAAGGCSRFRQARLAGAARS